MDRGGAIWDDFPLILADGTRFFPKTTPKTSYFAEQIITKRKDRSFLIEYKITFLKLEQVMITGSILDLDPIQSDLEMNLAIVIDARGEISVPKDKPGNFRYHIVPKPLEEQSLF